MDHPCGMVENDTCQGKQDMVGEYKGSYFLWGIRCRKCKGIVPYYVCQEEEEREHDGRPYPAYSPDFSCHLAGIIDPVGSFTISYW